MVRSIVAVLLAAGLAGCVVDPGPAYYGYDPGYGYAPGYYAPGYYAPGYYAGPSVGIVGVFGGGGHHHHHGGGHGRR
jgi:hypothetical protein